MCIFIHSLIIGILMIEGLSDFLSEELMVEALRQGHQVCCQLLYEWVYMCMSVSCIVLLKLYDMLCKRSVCRACGLFNSYWANE